jgi:broad specificity phosphatase PhoE
VSDLFCPATILLVRHGETEYEGPPSGDTGGCLTMTGRTQARALGESLRERRVAMIYSSSKARAVQTAEIAAGVLDVPVRIRHGLREFGIGEWAAEPFDLARFEPVIERWRSGDLSGACPGAESGSDVVHRVTAELNQIADEHRGETVLVVTHGGAMKLTVPALAAVVGDCWTDERELANCAAVELQVDADGWRCVSWAGDLLGV